MKRAYYDQDNQRLVHVGKAATEEFWDDRWEQELDPRWVRSSDRFVLSVTRRYLPPGSTVIDAGCGTARTVYGLHHAGYDAHGIDYAPKTVAAVKRVAPELQVSVGDVRSMPQFGDEYFDGVWSLGVIEHFYDGYEAILTEMRRVLKRDGFAFVTVPSLSPLRKAKATLGLYPPVSSADLEGFYQFVLQPASIIQEFKKAGFDLVTTKPRGGFLGFKDEIPLPLLDRFYKSKVTALRACRVGLDFLLSPLSYHTRLYVFKKSPSDTSIS